MKNDKSKELMINRGLEICEALRTLANEFEITFRDNFADDDYIKGRVIALLAIDEFMMSEHGWLAWQEVIIKSMTKLKSNIILN